MENSIIEAIKSSRENRKKEYAKNLKEIEKNLVEFDDAMEETKSLSGAMRLLNKLSKDRSNNFRLSTVQRTIIKKNDLDVMQANFKKTERRKWDGVEETVYKITVGKKVRTVKPAKNKKETDAKIAKKVKEMQGNFKAEIEGSTGLTVKAEKIDYSVEQDTKTHERKFTPKQALKVLNRAEAQYQTYRIKGMKSNNIEDLRACNGIFETEAYKDVA